MTIIREGNENLINPIFPEVVVIEKAPTPSFSTTNTNVVGMVFQTTRGNVGEIYEISNLNEFVKTFGSYTEGLDGYLFAKNYFESGGALIHGVRVASGTVATATATISGSTGSIFTLSFDTAGTEGNNTKAIITNNAVSGYFDIVIQNGNQSSFYSKVSTNSSDTRYIKTLIDRDSNAFVDITMTVTNGTMPSTGTTSFTGGTNGTVTGSSVPDSAYIGEDGASGRTGIQKFLEDDSISIIVSARNSDAINTALVAHAQSTEVTPRSAYIALAEGTSVATVKSTVASIIDDRVQVFYPLIKVRNPVTLQLENVNPTSVFSAIDSRLSYHISKAMMPLPAIVEGVEKALTLAEQKSLCDNGINPIVNKKGRGIILQSDFTRDNTPSRLQNSWRKAKNYFGINIERICNQFSSKPITESLWEDIRQTLTAFFESEQRAGRIGKIGSSKAYSVKLDSTNNPIDVIRQNKIIIEIAISLLALADKIYAYVDASAENTNVTI